MRILWWTFDFWPSIGGGAVIGTELARGLTFRGYELSVITQYPGDGSPERFSHDGIPVSRFPFHQALERRDLALISEIDAGVRDIVDEFEPDLIHLHTLAYPAFFCQRAIAGGRTRLLVTRHELFAEWPGSNSLAAEVLSRADWIACCSRAVLADVTESATGLEPRSSVILNGLHPSGGEPEPVDPNGMLLLCLGRLAEQKGFDLVIEALPRIQQQIPGVRLRVIGEGPYGATLRELTERLDLVASVEFVGALAPDQIPAAISASTIVIVPSRRGEAFGLVALEAAQAERPVVAARTGGLPEVVVDGETGLLFEPGDANALADAVCSLLDDRRLARRLGSAARDRALNLFSGERYLDEYDSLYRLLVGEPA